MAVSSGWVTEAALAAAIADLGWTFPGRLYCFNQLGSTQDQIAQYIGQRREPVFVSAYQQTKGRGQRGRQWSSPAGHIYCTLALPVKSADFPYGLSCVVGLSCLRALQQLGVTAGLRIKWPNDLIVAEKKCAGILVELLDEPKTGSWWVIGLGLNVDADLSSQLPKHAVALTALGQQVPMHATLLAGYLKQVVSDCALFCAQGFSAFITRWAQADVLCGQTIQVYWQDRWLTVVAAGVNDRGALIVDYQGKPLVIWSSALPIRWRSAERAYSGQRQ